MTPILAAQRLTKTYGPTIALAGVDLEVRSGESVAVMGASGSGKTTLLHVLAGIVAPDHGTVTLHDATGRADVTRLSDRERSRLRRERFGFVFQQGLLLPELTALENVSLALLLNGVDRAEADRRAAQWLAALGLAGTEDRRIGQLSGGQAQRVAIARAQVAGAGVVFADEPTGALDSRTSADVMTALLNATTGQGRTLVVVTHDATVAGRCDRIVQMQDGRIIAQHAGARPVPARPVAARAAAVQPTPGGSQAARAQQVAVQPISAHRGASAVHPASAPPDSGGPYPVTTHSALAEQDQSATPSAPTQQAQAEQRMREVAARAHSPQHAPSAMHPISVPHGTSSTYTISAQPDWVGPGPVTTHSALAEQDQSATPSAPSQQAQAEPGLQRFPAGATRQDQGDTTPAHAQPTRERQVRAQQAFPQLASGAGAPPMPAGADAMLTGDAGPTAAPQSPDGAHPASTTATPSGAQTAAADR